MNYRRTFLKSIVALAASAPLMGWAAKGKVKATLPSATGEPVQSIPPKNIYNRGSQSNPQNVFLSRKQDLSQPPTFDDARRHLPKPFWTGHETAVAGYWRAWELAFKNTHAVNPPSGFISPFIDTAFNGDIFMWDTVFILMFARYGERAFSFQKTLDNFYAKQHDDGFICRALNFTTGNDFTYPENPSSTGPNLLPWSEWEYFQQFGDKQRLADVFPRLLAYYQWFHKNRTWQNGTYWATGYGCGMDNQPRVVSPASEKFDHDHLSWIDTSAQAIFSADILMKMAAILGREADTQHLTTEVMLLTNYINQSMWNEKLGFYVDQRRDGSLSNVKSIGGYWTVIAGVATPERKATMLAHLSNPKTFGRPHPIPSLSADHPDYNGNGGYWRGSVWPPTNYMVLRGLTENGEHTLAHKLGVQHHATVTEVYKNTNTYWENYSPEKAAPGTPAKGDMVGWGGVGPIAVFLEYVIGLRPDFSSNVLVWDIRLTEAHGVQDYPLGKDATLQLAVAARADVNQAPVVEITSNRAVRVELRWAGGSRIVDIAAT